MTLTWRPGHRSRGTAFLLHGVTSSSSTWWRIGPALAAAGWWTTAVDLPGHGTGPRLRQADGAAGFIAQTAELLPPRVDLLIGHSIGAVVALMLAGRARALVLEDPPDDAGQRGPDPSAGALPGGGGRDAAIRWVSAQHPDWATADVAHSVDGFLAADVSGLSEVLASGAKWDLPALVAATTAPSLVLTPPAGADGALQRNRQAVRTLVGTSRFVELDGGHCLHRSRPAQWLRAVSSFTEDALH